MTVTFTACFKIKWKKAMLTFPWSPISPLVFTFNQRTDPVICFRRDASEILSNSRQFEPANYQDNEGLA